MIRRTFLALIVLVAALLVPAAANSAPAATCHVTWGSLQKTEAYTNPDYRPLINVRAGRHECFDRLVLEFPHQVDGFRVDYQNTEQPASLRGRAVMSLSVKGTAERFEQHPEELVDVTGYRTFRQVSAAIFNSEFALGVRARLPFRVFSWDNKIVVDVAHTW